MALTASSVASLNAKRPLFVFSVSALSSAAGVLAQAATVIVDFMDAQDIVVAKLKAPSGIDRFTQAQTWMRLESGESVYDGVRAWVRCEVVERVPAGDSAMYVTRAVESHIERNVTPGEAGDALVYRDWTWHNQGEHSVVGCEKAMQHFR